MIDVSIEENRQRQQATTIKDKDVIPFRGLHHHHTSAFFFYRKINSSLRSTRAFSAGK